MPRSIVSARPAGALRPTRARNARRAGALGLPVAVLVLAGCQGGSDPDPSAPSESDPPASAPASSAAPAGGLSCPDATALFALLPADGGTPRELGTPDTVCSGDWAEIGVSYPGSQGVALFRSVDGTWRLQDPAEACASGELPDDLRAGVCSAG